MDTLLPGREPDRIPLAHLPTPIETRELPETGRRVHIKRDDLTGLEVSGNKIRKLEYVLAAAVREGADALITCGFIQSNHCRTTVMAACRLGLQPYLLLAGDPSAPPEGNLFLDRAAGARIRFLPEEQYRGDRDGIMEAWSRELARQGLRAFVVPEGASGYPGNWGYIRAFGEILEQEASLGIRFDTIVVPVGSGGTYSGLYLGNRGANAGRRIVGINVYSNEIDMAEKVWQAMRQDPEIPQELRDVRPADLEIVSGYVGPGYGQNTPQELTWIVGFARRHGLFLDPVYTGKAFRALVDLDARGYFGAGEEILFLHTGGLFANFSRAGDFLRAAETL